MTRVTLQDIALRTGFTVNTVSRALKNKSDISAATREHIQQVAREMGYIRNHMASSLRSGRTRTIGVIVGGLSNPYYSVIADAIHDAAAEHRYSLLILCSRDDPDTELRAAETAISHLVDGIILFPCKGSERTIERLRAVGMPYVLAARHFAPGADDSVVCDEETGAYLAATHLIEAGKRRIGYLSRYDVFFSSECRLAGFLRACREAGLPEADIRTACCRSNDDIARTLIRWKSEGVDGLFSFCDEEAWNILYLLEQQGIHVPGDMALIGFDDLESVLHFPSSLCSVNYKLSQMAQAALELLLKRIQGNDLPPQTIVFEPTIVCRGSCGK